MSYSEAFQIGLGSIDKAWARYDPRKGKFGTFLEHFLRGDLIRELQRRRARVSISLDTSKQGERPLIETISADGQETDKLESELDIDQIYKHAFEIYTTKLFNHKRVKPVDLLFWGLANLKGRTRQRIGEHFGVSSQRVTQIVQPLSQNFARELKRRMGTSEE